MDATPLWFVTFLPTESVQFHLPGQLCFKSTCYRGASVGLQFKCTRCHATFGGFDFHSASLTITCMPCWNRINKLFSHTAASNQPGKHNLLNYTALYTDIVTLRCPEGPGVNITLPSWGRVVNGRTLGITHCYDNAFSCTISGGVIAAGGMLLLGNDDSGLYFCRSIGIGEEYYLNLTVLGT